MSVKLRIKKNTAKTVRQITIGDKVLNIKTACKNFGSAMLNDKGERVKKCKACKGDTLKACLHLVDIKIEKKAVAKSAKNSRGYVFPKEGTQAYEIDSVLASGILDVASICKATGLKSPRVHLRINSIKKRPNCPYFTKKA